VLCRIGISGLLVVEIRNWTVFNHRASTRSCRTIRMLLSSSHSSRASTTRTYEDGHELLVSFNSGARTSWRHWSHRLWLTMLLSSVMASQMCRLRGSMFLASCTAIVVTNLPAWLTSPPPLEKKKLAPRRFPEYLQATVRPIVDFPVPARPHSQKMHRSSCPPAQL
jgi:hypothetical protein